MTGHPIRVGVLEDHQGIIDGYLFRLGQAEDIQVVHILYYGEELEPALAKKQVDVLLLDINVPTSPQNASPYPILTLIPRLLQLYPGLNILVISMFTQRTLIHALLEAGASGYLLKDDQASIRELASIIRTLVAGGIHMSQVAHQELLKRQTGDLKQPLTQRQLEVLSLAAAYPNSSTADLAKGLQIAPSTLRNLLSNAYLKLDVRTRAAAIARARHLGLLPPENPDIDMTSLGGKEN